MPLSAATMAIFAAKGLDIEVADRLGFDSEVRDDVDWLVVPCIRDGIVQRRKFIDLRPGGQVRVEGAVVPFNEDVLKDDSLFGQPLVVVQDELEALASIQCGFQRTLAVPDGAPAADGGVPFDGARYAWIRDLRPRLHRDLVREIILGVDGDAPGLALMQDLSVQFDRFRCKFLSYPMAPDRSRRLTDLVQVLTHWAHKGVVETLQRAAFIQTPGVWRMSELPEKPPVKAYEAGFRLLDNNFRMRLGDFSVITGIPSHGKSAFANDFFCRQSAAHGFRILWASFEQDPQIDHRRALRTWHGGRPAFQLTPSELAAADAWIEGQHRFVLAPEEVDVTIDWMLEQLEQAVVQHDCHIVVIDPWNEMDHLRGAYESETEYVGKAIKRLKRFAKVFGVHLCVVAHPTKLKPLDGGKLPIPTAYDISGSSHWNNKADVIVIVHRENEDDTTIKIPKSRYHGEIGVPGAVSMQFCRDDGHYREMDRLL